MRGEDGGERRDDAAERRAAGTEAPDRRVMPPLGPAVDETATARPVEAGAPRPDLRATGLAVARDETRSLGVTVLAALAVLYTLYFARDFLRPIAFAILLDFFFSPFVRLLTRWRMRPPVGAAIVLLTLIGLLAVATYQLTGTMRSWATLAPETIAEAQEKLQGVFGSIEQVGETAARVEQVTGQGEEEPERVVVEGPSFVSRVFGTTQRLATGTLEVLVLLFFLLAAGDLFLQKLVKVLPNVRDKQAAVQVARKTESSISTYLLTAAAVNVGEGIVVAGAMYLLGMPNPLLWAVLVTFLEFIPYIGAAVIAVLLALVALTTFDTPGQMLLPPLVFIAINVVQGNFVSPLLLADRLTLNPVAVFVGLAFWWWIWGIAGAFIAVPMLAAFKILCDHVTPLAAVGEFLGQRDVRERRSIIRADERGPPAAA